MRYGIVEGEPGIFPDPIARVFRAIGGLFGGRRKDAPAAEPEAPPPPADETGPADEG
jgi:hypothetical protein